MIIIEIRRYDENYVAFFVFYWLGGYFCSRLFVSFVV
nr:MAG TPA: hypothetical protein [Caudoviricetes sp.]